MRADKDNRKLAIVEMAGEYLSLNDPRLKWEKYKCPVCNGTGCGVCRQMGAVFYAENFARVKLLDGHFIERMLNEG